MSKQKVPSSLRHSLWLAHKSKCVYCSEPLAFSEMDVDHVIPEQLKANEKEYLKIIFELGLSSNFDIHSVKNLLPAHRRCNLAKAGKIIDRSSMLFFLQRASDLAATVEQFHEANQSKRNRDTTVAILSDALERGILRPADLLDEPYSPGTLVLSNELVFADGSEGFITAERAVSLLDRPILMSGDEAKFGDNSGKQLYVQTCREYRAALALGFHASSTYDTKAEAFLKRANAILSAVEIAKVPKLSFIDKPFSGLADLHLIPVTIMPGLSTDEAERIAAMKDISFGDLLDSGEIKIVNISSHDLSLEWDGSGLMLRELLRADLNGDGIEDILCECYYWAIKGTLGFGWTSILSRQNADGMFAHSLI